MGQAMACGCDKDKYVRRRCYLHLLMCFSTVILPKTYEGF